MKKILIIEDDAILREELLLLLGFEGYEAIPAVSGQEGVILAQKLIPHLVISDIEMPFLDGFEVIAALHQDPQTVHIPIIMMSGREDEGYDQRSLQLGAEVYLAKPCPFNKLLDAIRSQIGC